VKKTGGKSVKPSRKPPATTRARQRRATLDEWLRARFFGELAMHLRTRLQPILTQNEAFTPTFQGACAVASVALLRAMRSLHVRGATFILGKFRESFGSYVATPEGGWTWLSFEGPAVEHCWVEWRDFLIDITYSQFHDSDGSLFRSTTILTEAEVLVAPIKYVPTHAAEQRGERALAVVSEWNNQSPAHFEAEIDAAVKGVLRDFRDCGTRLARVA